MLVSSAALFSLGVPQGAQAQLGAQPFVPGEVLVTYHTDVGDPQAAQAVRAVGGTVRKTLRRSRRQLLRFGAQQNLAAVIAQLRRNPAVAAAQPNYIYRASVLHPNDFKYEDGGLWGLNNFAQFGGTADADIDAPEAWSLSETSRGSRDIAVAIIDSGIDYAHPALVQKDAAGEIVASNVWTNPGEIPGNSIDDDGNGYVDDVHGINAIADSGDPMDDNDHGTHVAGTIGAIGNNGDEIVGVNWQVSMIGCKFLAADGSGTTADAVQCLDYIHALKRAYLANPKQGANIVATNNSWGGGGADPALQTAIEESNKLGILFVAAAGNGDYFGRAINNDASPQYPASYSNANILSVTATDRNDRKASFANYGAKSVDLGAPGVDILSSIVTNPADAGTPYANFSGTSMATPHVTGAVALLAAYNPSLTALQLKQQILDTGDPVAALSTNTLTGRRLNVYNALATPLGTAPAAPSDLGASAVSASQIDLTWRDNSSNESGYRIVRSDNVVRTVAGNVTRFSDTGLQASRTYSYTVVAYNAYGDATAAGPASATTLAAPAIPSAPAGLMARAISRSQITLSWTDTSSNESGFKIERWTGWGWAQVAVVGPNVTTYTNSGLSRNSTYHYRLRTYNAAGHSAYTPYVSATTLR